MNRMVKRAAPSLVTLCIWTANDNVQFLGDVGETDIDLLAQILPRCTAEQLEHIENCSKGRDLSSVTGSLWKRFYESEFGSGSAEVVVERMKQKKVSFPWRQLYKAKLKEMDNAQMASIDKIKELYKKDNARKQSRQVQLCTKVPPSGKRSFWGGNGSGASKSNIMKKAKIEFMNSREVKNLAALKNSSPMKTNRVSGLTLPVVPGKNLASTSRPGRTVERRW